MTLRSLFTAGALVTLGMLVGRLLGLLREILIASSFGVGPHADMAIMLLILPDFVAGAFVGTTASATLVHAYAARSKENAAALMWQALALSVGLFVLIALVILTFETSVMQLMSSDASAVQLSTLVFLLYLGSLPLTAATATFTAWLQFRHRFTVPAFATAIFNGVIILTLWLVPAELTLFAIGILLAALCRLLPHIFAFMRAEGGLIKPSFMPWQIDKALLKSYAATASTGIFSMFPQYAPYIILAAMGAGVAAFNYAFKLILVPAMLAVSVIQLVLLPWLIHQRGRVEVNQATLQCAWVLALALSFALTLASHDIALLCFGYGKMTPEDVALVGNIFAFGVWALPGMLLSSVWQQILYAEGKPRVPLLANAMLAVLVVPACWLGNRVMGLEGIALNYALIQIIPVIWLSYAGFKEGIISAWSPSTVYTKMTLAMVAVWVPCAVLFSVLTLPVLGGLFLAVIAGSGMLTAGLAFCPAVKDWLKKVRLRA